MGALLTRKSIAQDFDSKYYILANMLEDELDDTKKIFDEQNQLKLEAKAIHVHRNMPDVSGGMKWCQELKNRVSKPMENFKKLVNHPITESEQMARIDAKYEEMFGLIEKFANDIYQEWCKHVGQLSDDNLEKNLISRNEETNIIQTNFDSQLTAVLKEVKYLGMLKQEEIPESALNIHSSNDQYRKFITSLDYTADSYNKILKNASAEEKPLIADELAKIDAEIKSGEENLKWKTPGIEEYIVNIRNKVSDLETRLQKTKTNLDKVTTLMNTWADTPLFKRYEQKSTLLQLDDKDTRIANRSKEITETGQKIHELVKENKTLLNVTDEESEIWKDYTVYVDNMIYEGFNKIVACSLNYFLKETDFIKFDVDPIFEAQLQLAPPELVFAPSLNYGDPAGFYEMVENNINQVYKQGSLIPRVASHLEQKDYQVS